MLINEIMEYIWKDVSYKYNLEFQRFMLLSDAELVREISVDLQTMERGINSDAYAENILPTCGCNNRHRNGKLSGCAMCDWESDNYMMSAKMAALKKKNRKLYADMLRKSIEINRGEVVIPAVIEEFATHDLLDESDIISEFYDDIFVHNKLYASRPFVGIMAARPNSITSEKVRKWKEQYRKSLIVGMGVEVADEWLRNHWLNKNTSQEALMHALYILEEEKVFAGADVLFGIPGIPAGLGINILKESLGFLYETSVQSIVISPLSRKNLTLQNFVYNNFSSQENFIKLYGNEKYFTDIPSPYTLLQGLHEAVNEISGVEKKIKISPQNTMAYLHRVKYDIKPYDLTNGEKLILDLFDKMAHYNTSSVGIKVKDVEDIYKIVKEEKTFIDHLETIKKQQENRIADVLRFIMHNIISLIWENSAQKKIMKFEEELTGYDK